MLSRTERVGEDLDVGPVPHDPTGRSAAIMRLALHGDRPDEGLPMTSGLDRGDVELLRDLCEEALR